MKIGFLHTSPVHVPTFENLLEGKSLQHEVDEELLAYAMEHGNDESVIQRVTEYVSGLAQAGCSEIVCSCSTIGGVAESLEIKGVNIFRIDRPMAAKAVAEGHVILMAAAIRSTLLPTRELLLDESAKQKRPIRIVELIIEAAWPHFLAGDLASYYQTIESEIRQTLQGDGQCAPKLVPEIVVLAQGSMAPAADLLRDLNQPVLSSPTLCADYLKRAQG